MIGCRLAGALGAAGIVNHLEESGMRVNRSLVSALVLGSTLAVPPAAAGEARQATPTAMPTYAITELATLGGEGSRALGINERGQVVGEADDPEGRTRAVVWEAGRPQDLGTLGGEDSVATEINDAGQIAGFSTTGPGQELYGPGTHAFLWDDGAMTDLGTLGGQTSFALHLNGAGQVVGQSEDAMGRTRAFLWTGGTMTDLGTLGGAGSRALGINDAGAIVGAAEAEDGRERAVVWQGDRLVELETPEGATSGASAINAPGQVVGHTATADGDVQAVSWVEGRLTPLGSLGGESQAYAINGMGHIVGSSTTAGDELLDDPTHAVVWAGGEIIGLAGATALDSDWELRFPTGINGAGQIIVFGSDGGAPRAFLLTPAAGASTPAAVVTEVDVADVVRRAQRAIREAGAYRYRTFRLHEADGEPTRLGEVEIGVGIKTQATDGSNLEYYDGQTLYTLRPDGG